MNHQQLEQELNKGRATACWRSQLYWLWNDGDKDAFAHIVARVQRYLPNASVRPPSLSHSHQPEVRIEFEEDGTTFDISTSGGGLRTLLNLAVVLEFSDSQCLLLDEPDAHLHSTLQRSVGQMLADYSQEEDVQLIIASHAPDLISEVPVDSLVWVDRTKGEAGVANSLANILSDLGALSKADAIRAHGADKILFVEGSLDCSLLSAFFDMCSSYNPFNDPTVVVAPLPSGKGNAVHLGMFRRLLQDTFRLKTKVACILDADYELQPSGSRSDADVLTLVLQRKEIENYLISADLLAKASNELVRKRCEQTGENLNQPRVEEWQSKIEEVLEGHEIRDTVRFQVVPQHQATLDPTLAPSTKYAQSESWFEGEWSKPEYRLQRCPGKKVLADLRRWCQSTYKISLTKGALRRAIDTCPPDIKEIAENVEKYFGSS